MPARTVRRRMFGLAAATAVALTALTTPAVAANAPAAPAAPATGHRMTREAMDAQVTAGVPGVLGQARDAHGTWPAISGTADLTTDRPRRAEDRFRVGSITKTFVATVLLQLEAEHRLDLDDPVERWLPGLVRGNGYDGSRITVRQLLNHTSGVHNYTSDPAFKKDVFGKGFLKHRYGTYTPEQLVRIALAHRPDFAPGASWNYSNTNYVLAGLIVREVTGHSYATEVERRVIEPLNLRATTVPGRTAAMPRPSGRSYSTLGDRAQDAKIHDVTELNPSMAWSAGEMISSAGDLNRFYSALLRGKLLPEAQLREMLTTVPSGESGRYGLGLMSQSLPCGVTVWGHDGGIHGSNSTAVTTRDGGHAAAFNLNADWTGGTGDLLEAEFCGRLRKP